MIQLSMELPTCKLKEWSPLADLDFVLAHKVLEDKAYAKHFLFRPAGRELILDNSLHELGYPLPSHDLLIAARLCNASYIIAPDRAGDVVFNRLSFLEARQLLWPEFKLAVVMTGTPDLNYVEGHTEREQFLYDVREADMLCLTFKQPKRFEWYAQSTMAHRWKRVHLLGCAELRELYGFALLANNTGRVWSIDTGKALKHAIRGSRMDELKTVRLNVETTEKGLPSAASQKILEITEEELSRIPFLEENFRYNIEVLRRHL